MPQARLEGLRETRNEIPGQSWKTETKPCLVPSRGEIRVLGAVEVSCRAGREEDAAGILDQNMQE